MMTTIDLLVQFVNKGICVSFCGRRGLERGHRAIRGGGLGSRRRGGRRRGGAGLQGIGNLVAAICAHTSRLPWLHYWLLELEMLLSMLLLLLLELLLLLLLLLKLVLLLLLL